MAYNVYSGFNVIEVAADVEVHSGCLVCKNHEGKITSIYSPGKWAEVHLKEEESE